MSILHEIAAVAAQRVASAKNTVSSEALKAEALSLPKGDFSFEKALKHPGLSFICECKKASPSKGIIAEDFPYLDIAKEYEAAGADAISCLTEPKWFLGSDEYLKEIAANVKIPVLRKDFTVDEYMIYEAKVFGASAVLLIMSILTDEQVKEYMSICDTLGLSALVECHDEEEIKRALDCGGRVIGVNNRNLKDFSVDMGLAARLRSLIPEDKVFVSESGIKDAGDIAKVKEMGADAVLMGEVLMRSSNKAELLNSFK